MNYSFKFYFSCKIYLKSVGLCEYMFIRQDSQKCILTDLSNKRIYWIAHKFTSKRGEPILGKEKGNLDNKHLCLNHTTEAVCKGHLATHSYRLSQLVPLLSLMLPSISCLC